MYDSFFLSEYMTPNNDKNTYNFDFINMMNDLETHTQKQYLIQVNY